MRAKTNSFGFAEYQNKSVEQICEDMRAKTNSFFSAQINKVYSSKTIIIRYE